MKKLVSILFAAAAGLVGCGKKTPTAPGFNPPDTLSIGATAPDFKLPGVDGKTWALADFASQPVLCVVFLANHCPTSQAYEERIKRIAADYGPKGVSVVAISSNSVKGLQPDELAYTDLNDTLEDMKTAATRGAFNFPYLYDGDTQLVAKSYGPAATPHAFVFGKDRKLAYTGRVDDHEREKEAKTNDLRNALDAILAGRAPSPAKTKAYGCSIKWAEYAPLVERYVTQLATKPITLQTVDAAGIAKLREPDGKVRLINVWATFCGPCRKEFPALVEIDRIYGGRNFEVVTLAAQNPDEKESVLKFLKEHQAATRNLILADSDKAKLLESLDKEWSGALPFTLLLDGKGGVLYKHTGMFDPAALKTKIVDTLGRELLVPAEHR